MTPDNDGQGTARVPGLSYAVTEDGLTLPVIDVTHPAFAIDVSEADVEERTIRFVEESRARQRNPPEAQAQVMQALQSARLGRALSGAAGGFVDGMTLYLMKLGPDHQWAGATPIDRAIAASFPSWTTRVRLQDMASLLADGLQPRLEASPGRGMGIVDIAGGPAADALNALIVLRARDARSLTDRSVTIDILDGDPAGPLFGQRSLESLRGQGAPLHGANIRLDHTVYDWRDTAPLVARLKQLRDAEAIVAASSEGGLFEYGSEEAIAANLTALRDQAPPDSIVVGSFTRDDGAAVMARDLTRYATVPRSMAAFGALVESAGWQVETAIERPLSRHFRLIRRA